jgi:hypothetical protein
MLRWGTAPRRSCLLGWTIIAPRRCGSAHGRAWQRVRHVLVHARHDRTNMADDVVQVAVPGEVRKSRCLLQVLGARPKEARGHENNATDAAQPREALRDALCLRSSMIRAMPGCVRTGPQPNGASQEPSCRGSA